MVTIVNYGSGNICAIANIYERIGIPYVVANKPSELESAERIFLPGVGAFDETIRRLDQLGFREILDVKVLKDKTPIIGICVGMQILAESSEEGSLPGLGYIDGKVRKLDASLIAGKPKLPHLGWNSIKVRRSNPILDNVDTESGFYFLHTYYFDCDNDNDILAETLYGKSFASAVNRDNVYGMQFHPEKSHHNGLNVLRNFALLEC